MCTSDVYWSGLISAGTPGGYDFSQILSINVTPVSNSIVISPIFPQGRKAKGVQHACAFAIAECDAIGQRA
jgi:hypothetical protein